MSKHEEITLRIEKPCNADWNSMAVTPKGKHCGICAKHVFDATHLQPEEILAILKAKKGNVCMRLNSEVVNTPLLISKITWYATLIQYYRKAALFAGLQFLFFNQLKAQMIKVFVSDKNADNIIKKYFKSVVIDGAIMEHSGSVPIEFAQVTLIKNNKILATCLSNQEGEYSLNVKDSIEDNSPVKLVFTAFGHKKYEIDSFLINKQHITIDKIFLALETIELSEVTVENHRSKPVIMGLPFYIQSQTSRTKIIINAFPLNTVDPSPRQPRIDIQGGGSDLLR